MNLFKRSGGSTSVDLSLTVAAAVSMLLGGGGARAATTPLVVDRRRTGPAGNHGDATRRAEDINKVPLSITATRRNRWTIRASGRWTIWRV